MHYLLLRNLKWKTLIFVQSKVISIFGNYYFDIQFCFVVTCLSTLLGFWGSSHILEITSLNLALRIFEDRCNPLKYDNLKCVRRYRLSKESFSWLLSLVQDDLDQPMMRSNALNDLQQFCDTAILCECIISIGC